MTVIYCASRFKLSRGRIWGYRAHPFPSLSNWQARASSSKTFRFRWLTDSWGYFLRNRPRIKPTASSRASSMARTRLWRGVFAINRICSRWSERKAPCMKELYTLRICLRGCDALAVIPSPHHWSTHSARKRFVQRQVSGFRHNRKQEFPTCLPLAPSNQRGDSRAGADPAIRLRGI